MREILAGLLVVSFGAAVVAAPVAWVLIIVYMCKTVANRKPGVDLWRDAPGRNPWNHILITEHLTEQGLMYRRRLGYSVAAFVIPILLAFVFGGLAGAIR